MASHIETVVENIVMELLADTELELVDVEYVKEQNWYLRVYIDKPGGIGIDDCQGLSEKLEAKLDECDPIKESYFLEVSSPGLDRALKKDRDLIRHEGDTVEVSTYAPVDGSKSIVGTLQGFTETELLVGGKTIERAKIANVKLYLDI